MLTAETRKDPRIASEVFQPPESHSAYMFEHPNVVEHHRIKPIKEATVRNLRTLAEVVKHAGLGPLSLLFLCIYLLCSAIVWFADPTGKSFGDAMWFCFQVVTTIGFGDISVDAGIARGVTIVLSIFSIFYIALITGVVVSYTTERMHLRQEDTLARFVNNLEHLDSMSKEELASLSENVREWRKKSR